mgnify:CR=1 FL=1
MNKIYSLIVMILICFVYSGQEIPSYDEFEVYTQDKDNKILIIPFENKMYASAVDNEIAAYNRINYIDVKEELKKGISSQILLKISNKTPAISMVHHKDSVSEILNYIYNNIGLKYEKVKVKDTVQPPTSKTELIKDRLKKFVVQTNQHHEKAKYERGEIKNGEVNFSGQKIPSHKTIKKSNFNKTQLGIRPEFINFSNKGIPVKIKRVSNTGRHKIIDTESSGGNIKILSNSSTEIPSGSAHITFNQKYTYVYEDNWIIE